MTTPNQNRWGTQQRNMTGGRGRGDERGKGKKWKSGGQREQTPLGMYVFIVSLSSYHYFHFLLPLWNWHYHWKARLSVHQSAAKQVRLWQVYQAQRDERGRLMQVFLSQVHTYERKGVRNKCTSAASAVLKELNTSVRGVIELHINFSDSCCKQHVSRRGGRER